MMDMTEGRADRLEAAIERLIEAQTRTEQRMEELAQAQARTEKGVEELAQAQARTEKRVDRLEVAVEQLIEAQARTEKRVEELAQAQARTEKRVEELAQAQARTEKRVEELTQALTHLAQRVEQLTATVERIQMDVSTLKTDVAGLKTDVAGLKIDVAGLKTDVAGLKTDVAGLKTDVAGLKGSDLERKYRQHAGAFFGRLLQRPWAVLPDEMEAEMYAEVEERLTSEELEDLLRADLLVTGRPKHHPGAPTVWLAVEVSSVIDSHDVARAQRRADALRKAGHRAIPTVAGEQVTMGAEGEASAGNVLMVRDGSIHFWEEALKAALAD